MAKGRDITSEVKRIVKEKLKVQDKDIKPKASFFDHLGADSLTMAELFLALGEHFEIDIPNDHWEKILTVEDAVSYISDQIKK